MKFAESAMRKVIDINGRKPESNDQVLERLFSEHIGALRGFIRMRLGVGEDLDDVIQEVFARLARLDNLAERLPIDGESNRSYLFAVANNLVVDMERRKVHLRRYVERQQSNYLEELECGSQNPESIVLAHDDIKTLRQVIFKMKPTWRDAFILTRIQCLSYKEAADHMGVTIKQIEGFLTRAFKHIRKADISIIKEEKK
ncbi:RNA polymerase sigma factor [Porticoccaceae bacterium LTM1]|nr:RNA polymerase sigma factor [Porticoccaceae bacterium LTM1]